MTAADQKAVEDRALRLLREHAIRAMSAWHLAVAALALPSLVEPGEDAGLATRERCRPPWRRAWDGLLQAPRRPVIGAQR